MDSIQSSISARFILKRKIYNQSDRIKYEVLTIKRSSLSDEELSNGIVCDNAGNHAQGVAMSCKLLKTHGTIYIPTPTPIQQVKMFGGCYVTIEMHAIPMMIVIMRLKKKIKV
jgi:threonine dehydratase